MNDFLFGKSTDCKRCVKIMLRRAACIFFACFFVLGDLLCTTFHFDAFELSIALLMFKIILTVLVLIIFNCKTQLD